MQRGRRLFIISDLHLGGRAPAMCDAHRELVEYVDWVRALPETEERELVINGDIVDFLAEDDDIATSDWTVDDKEAIAKLDRIVERTRVDCNGKQRGFFDALADMLRDGHRVTIMLGNHDVELSLPAVRRRLEQLLGDGKLRFIYDGEAYVVGRALIEHGNRYDQWNVVNFDRLREERAVRSRGMPITNREHQFFRAPAGTFLVTTFMNPLKRQYRFIDLLKPETGAVIPLLLALEPELDLGLRSLLRALPLLRQGVLRDAYDDEGMPLDRGELGGIDEPEDMPLTLDDVLRQELGADAALFAGEANHDDGEMGGIGDLWAHLKAMAKQLRETVDMVATLLSIRQAASDDVRRKRLVAALTHTAQKDRSFNLEYEITSYRRAATTLCKQGGFDVVVFGHTHLPKQIDLSAQVKRKATYLNTGSWASVMRLDTLPQPIDEAFIDAVKENRLDAYIRRYLTYAEIRLEGDAVAEATIRSFCGKERPREQPLTAAP